MESATTRSGAIDIDELERALRAELVGVQLVGQIDMDTWGVRAEAALRSRVHRCEPGRLRRLWPATLTTYLVYQGLFVYEHDGFWPQLSIPELRDGSTVGPEFEVALRDLGLDTFDDIEAVEGIARDGRGRYIRRIHLHGGIPRASVGPVMRLLEGSLRDGMTDATEIVDSWTRLDLADALHSKAAERCLTYARDFATSLVGSLIELIRQTNTGSWTSASRVPLHLVEGVQEYAERDHSTSGWNFARGPVIGIDPHRSNPFLEVPEGRDVVWSVNGEEIGISSRTVRERWELPLPGEGLWFVEADSDDGTTVRGYSTELPPAAVLVFDQLCRLHRRGAPLEGRCAHLVGSSGLVVDAVIDERSLDGEWAGLTLRTVDLREMTLLEIVHAGSSTAIPIVNSPAVHISQGPVEGIVIDERDVLSDRVTIAFDRFTPVLDEVVVTGPGRSIRLGEARRLNGDFDVTDCFRSDAPCTGVLTVAWGDQTLFEVDVAYVPSLTVVRPRLAPPSGDVVVQLTRMDRGRRRTTEHVVPGGASSVRVDVSLVPGARVTRVQVNRLAWDLIGRQTIAPMLGSKQFSVRLPELHEHSLVLRTNGVPVKVALVGGSVTHQEPARTDRQHPSVRSCNLKAFAETVRTAKASAPRLVVVSGGDEPIEVGSIERRYEPTWLRAQVTETLATRSLIVEWGERSEWPDREVRLWGDALTEPALAQAVDAGQRRAVVAVDSLHAGRYLVEVGTKSPHVAPVRPVAGATCRPIYVGSSSATRLREAVAVGDRKERFSDHELDELVPLFADLLEEQRGESPSRSQRLALLERIADENWRLIDVVTELDDRFGDPQASRPELIEPFLMDLLPLAWVNPITNAVDGGLTGQIEHLWTIAPSVAASVDRSSPLAVSAFDDCQRRWRDYAGLDLSWGQPPNRRLDHLVAQIPKPTKFGAVDQTAPGGAKWAAALAELTGARVAHGESELYQHHGTLRGLERAVRNAPSTPPWAGIVIRVTNAMKPYDKHCGWFTDLVRLSCELLDPVGLAVEDELLEALAAAQRVCPLATRTAVVLTAAALRLRHESGPTTKGAR